MLKGLYRLSDYLYYLFSSKTRHGIHSPFVYQFNENILQKDQRNPVFEQIEVIRRKMIKSDARIEFLDLVGGNKSGRRSLGEIAANTARQSKYGRFLYRLIYYLQPDFSIELGTATGITALYQSAGLQPGKILHTVEGSAKLTEIALFNAEQCGLNDRLIFHTGNFDTVLPNLLKQMPQIDYAYIDGNHRYEPTLHYFDLLASKSHPGTVLVFDDINWNEDMKNAWAAIKKDHRVSITIDIFAFGIVFFHPGQKKEHFTIRY